MRKHLPKSISNAKGHIRKKMSICSTKPKPIPSQSASNNNFPAEMMTLHVQKRGALFRPLQITGKIETNQMGRFQKTSSNGSNYVISCYVHDTNGILTECLKSRKNKELTRAFTAIYDSLVECGLTPTVQFLDNECPPRPCRIHEENFLLFNSFLPTTTNQIQQKKRSVLWKTISLRVFPA